MIGKAGEQTAQRLRQDPSQRSVMKPPGPLEGPIMGPIMAGAEAGVGNLIGETAGKVGGAAVRSTVVPIVNWRLTRSVLDAAYKVAPELQPLMEREMKSQDLAQALGILGSGRYGSTTTGTSGGGLGGGLEGLGGILGYLYGQGAFGKSVNPSPGG